MLSSGYSVFFMLSASIILSSCQQAYNSCFCPAYLPFLQPMSRILYVWDTHKSHSQVVDHRVRKKNYTKFLAAYFRHSSFITNFKGKLKIIWIGYNSPHFFQGMCFLFPVPEK